VEDVRFGRYKRTKKPSFGNFTTWADLIV